MTGERVRASLLWGVVGTLSFLVLVQGYHLLAEPLLGIPAIAGVALLVGAAATAGTYVLHGVLAEDEP